MMRDFDPRKIAERCVRAVELLQSIPKDSEQSLHPAPRVYSHKGGILKYRVGPGDQYVLVFVASSYATITNHPESCVDPYRKRIFIRGMWSKKNSSEEDSQ